MLRFSDTLRDNLFSCLKQCVQFIFCCFGSSLYICPVGNDILEHILDHMVVLHDSGLYIRTVLITKCSTDISCRCQHFLCMCKLPDSVVILVCIRVSDSLDSGKHAHRVACRNSTYVSSS